ncbi:hypothetical protein [Deinococcus sp.]|uniref:hypothetical protein n=1 Tax=Deinococcus sp. TaxID=47478 RepID=UPI0025E617F5|nr:hypothetical protein [Deinococcus sp.]
MPSRPFRWTLSRPEGLVRRPDSGPLTPLYLFSELRSCAARVVGAAGERDLIFLGRSPESLFDYLSGVLHGTAWEGRLDLLLYSNRGNRVDAIRRDHPGAIEAMRAQFTEAGLAPAQLLTRPRPVAIIDLVAEGGTFEGFSDFLEAWSAELGVNLRAWRSRLRFVGIVRQRKNSPNAFRWQQHAPWLDRYPPGTACNVSVPSPLWNYLGNTQMKVTPSNPPRLWGRSELLSPPRQEEHLEALQAAAQRYTSGTDLAERARFAALLSGQRSMRERWCRELVLALRAR